MEPHEPHELHDDIIIYCVRSWMCSDRTMGIIYYTPGISVTFWGLSYIIDVDGVSYIFGGRGLS